MKKRICFLAALCLCLFLSAIAANADVLPISRRREPRENAFLVKHKEQCVPLGRYFIANGANGTVSVKKEPGARRDSGTLKNGERFSVQSTCLYQNEYWGHIWQRDGWVKMDQLLLPYDHVSFAKDHADKIYPYTRGPLQIIWMAKIVIWLWPGSDAERESIELPLTRLGISHGYKDEKGREWGFVPTAGSRGSVRRNFWICLSDLANANIEAFNPAPEPSVWKPETAHVDIKPLKGKATGGTVSALALIIGLMMALVGGTIVSVRRVF
jgi:hypothetical protein